MRIALLISVVIVGGVAQLPLSAQARMCIDDVERYNDLGHAAFERAVNDEQKHRDPCRDLKEAIQLHSKAVQLGKNPQCSVGLPQPEEFRAGVRDMEAELQIDIKSARGDRCIAN